MLPDALFNCLVVDTGQSGVLSGSGFLFTMLSHLGTYGFRVLVTPSVHLDRGLVETKPVIPDQLVARVGLVTLNRRSALGLDLIQLGTATCHSVLTKTYDVVLSALV